MDVRVEVFMSKDGIINSGDKPIFCREVTVPKDVTFDTDIIRKALSALFMFPVIRFTFF